MFDSDASTEMEIPLVFPGDDGIRKKYLKQYRLALLILGILCLGLVITVIVGVTVGIGCKRQFQVIVPSARPSHSFIHVSDLHLDNYYDPKISTKTFCRKIDPKFNISVQDALYVANYGRVGCDAPTTLVELMVQEAGNLSKVLNDLEFIILTGDQSAHNMEKYFVKGTVEERVLLAMNNVRAMFEKHLPDMPFLPCFGNNDLPGDYHLPPTTSFYGKVMEIWKPFLTKKCKSCEAPMVDIKDLASTFLQGGFYKAMFQTAGQQIVILSLNTNYWTLKPYQPVHSPPPNASIIAANQMAWLEKQLKMADIEKRKAIIFGHVPPGIDPYNGEALWFQNYTKQYLKLVTDTFQHTIVAQLYGHFHKDEFKVQTFKDFDASSDESKVRHAIMIAPGVTPVYANNPSFRVVEFSKMDGDIIDYEQYYMDLVMATEFGITSWTFDYRFNAEYGLSPSPEGFMQLAKDLIDPKDRSVRWNKYIRHRQVNYQSRPYSRFQLYCAARFSEETLYKQCITKYNVPGG